MQQYLDLLNQVLREGTRQQNRTGIDTFMIPGAMMKFDLDKGFPAVTTKKLAFKSVVGELLGFLKGCTSAKDFRDLGCNVWNQNANENEAWLKNPNRQGEDDLGYIYSRLWTDMPYSLRTNPWNQIQKLIEGIRTDPTSRRLIVSAWHPEVFDRAALPPCHVLFQVIIEQSTKKMHMLWYQRSNDMFLGVPFNIASYALLLSLIAKVTGYTPGTLTWFGADVHIYENHLGQVLEQLRRKPLALPTISFRSTIKDIFQFTTEDIALVDYVSHPTIKAPMAV